MSQQALLNMQRIESNEAGMLVFLSDVHFDKVSFGFIQTFCF